MSTTTPTRRRTPTVRALRVDEPDHAGPGLSGADRGPLAPAPARRVRRAGDSPRGQRGRLPGWPPRRTRVGALAMLAVSLVVLLGGALAVNAVAAPGRGPVAAQPAPTPLTSADPCAPDSPLPDCHQSAPTRTPPAPVATGSSAVACFPGSLHDECLHPSAAASPTGAPCVGEGCVPPRPATTAPAPSDPGGGQPGDSGGDAECGFTNVAGCVTNAINGFFRGIVTAALNPLLDLLSRTLLTTPTPDSLPRVGELWANSWQILLASYSLLILIAGVLVMGHETVQTRHSVKEVAPRIVLGFLAGAVSLWVATAGIELANALAQGVMGGAVDAASAGDTLRDLVLGSLNGGIFIVVIGVVLAGMLVALLVTYIVRVALTVILIAGAPLALMCHALPQTEGVAVWWWKAYGGCLAIQVVQSLTLITALRVFLAPGGYTLFGPTTSGLINLLVAVALVYILFKIPFWVLGSIRGGGGRSLIGSLVRGFITYKTFGLLRGGGGGGGGGRPAPSGGGHGGGGGGGPADPYARTRTTADGQHMLPLAGLRRTRPPRTPAPQRPTTPNAKRGAQRGRQLGLPLGDDWPENKPVLGRDGQFRLPLDVERVKTPPPPSPPAGPGSGRGRRRRGQQLELPLDPYRGNRPDRSGQYRLPLDGVRRTRRPPSPPPPPPPVPARPRSRGAQMELPFDPYKGNRATRGGQYPLPLDGVRRAPAAPAPATATSVPVRPAPRAGRQLRLPLDLPKPPRRTPPPSPPPAPPSAARRRKPGGTT